VKRQRRVAHRKLLQEFLVGCHAFVGNSNHHKSSLFAIGERMPKISVRVAESLPRSLQSGFDVRKEKKVCLQQSPRQGLIFALGSVTLDEHGASKRTITRRARNNLQRALE
jgi:hypothetical protein